MSDGRTAADFLIWWIELRAAISPTRGGSTRCWFVGAFWSRRVGASCMAAAGGGSGE
ncbi:hypothetical protein PanWU01x14_065420, partial [Parasponia andersonii]